jgi:hypothetical protein
MNRHERRAREAQQRQATRALNWKAGMPGEVHLGGGYSATSIAEMGGVDKVVTVCFRFGSATFKAAIPTDKIGEVLALQEKAASQVRAAKCDPRQEAMSWVLKHVKGNKHITDHQTGAIISYDVTEGGTGYGNNWRLAIDGLPGDVDHLPVPKHPFPTTPGGPALAS